jgi:hypothetical protein
VERDLPAVSYRCVCGETVPLDEVDGGVCASCSRHYSGDVLRSAFAETMQLGEAGTEASVPSSDTSEQDPRIGKTFGHCKIIARLGEGGMGSVYRALDKSLQRYVALKVIRSGEQSSTGTTQLQRLFQEVIAQARVNHPVFQMLTLWAGALVLGLQMLGADIVLALAGAGISLTVIVDSALALVRRDGRSLHDLLFDTRVVLDVSRPLDAAESDSKPKDQHAQH